LVHREDEIAPIAAGPYRSWMVRIPRATVPIASSHSTSRHSSVIRSRTIGLRIRSGCEA
jgi:hypothetical protein